MNTKDGAVSYCSHDKTDTYAQVDPAHEFPCVMPVQEWRENVKHAAYHPAAEIRAAYEKTH